MDDNYQTYLNRVARMMLPDTYKSQVQHIHTSSKFQPQPSGGRKAVSFPGYTVITPPASEDTENSAFYSRLNDYAAQLQLETASGVIVPIPNASFHLTLADLIWDSAYRYANEKNPQFGEQLGVCITQIFQQYQKSITSPQGIRWQMLGLTVMPRAVAICLLPKDQESYEQLLQFRRAIYQNPDLMALGIEQQYNLTAHITLGYFGDVTDIDRDRLSQTFWELNQQWLEDSPEYLVQRAELRKFDDMTRYDREPDWPVLNF